jgi:hypothetical protein
LDEPAVFAVNVDDIDIVESLETAEIGKKLIVEILKVVDIVNSVLCQESVVVEVVEINEIDVFVGRVFLFSNY